MEAFDGLLKGRSLSDQPATCPLCGAILRQSRNLRRHLELLHFGLGNNGKSSVHSKHRKGDRPSDFHRTSLVSALAAHAGRSESHSKLSESSDFPTMTPLSASTASSSTSNVSLSGNLMGPSAGLLTSGEHGLHSIPGVSSSSCSASMGPPNNGIYASDGSASMLSCLLPSLPSLPTLSSPHDVFRHGEMLRAGIAYHDTSRQHARHMQRTDVT